MNMDLTPINAEFYISKVGTYLASLDTEGCNAAYFALDLNWSSDFS
jgi:hypothetical protein